MKKIILSAVMLLALAGGSVFAGTTQDKTAGGTKTASSAGMKKTTRKHKRAHKKSAKMSSSKKANSNSK